MLVVEGFFMRCVGYAYGWGSRVSQRYSSPRATRSM